MGPPPPTPGFAPREEGWTPLKEPSPLMLNLVATPVGVAAAVLVALCWGSVTIQFDPRQAWFGAATPLVGAVLGLLALIAVHELIHVLGYRRFGFTAGTFIACWPAKLLFYAHTYDPLSRNRLLLVYALPLLVLTVLPLVVCRALGWHSGMLMLASTVNALAAGGDIFCFFLILAQVPAQAIVRNQGWATWWTCESISNGTVVEETTAQDSIR